MANSIFALGAGSTLVSPTVSGTLTALGDASGNFGGGKIQLNNIGGGADDVVLSNGSWNQGSTPVPFFRSGTLNHGVAFDLMPNGAAADCWMDVCSTDITADSNNFECVTVMKHASSYAVIGTKKGGSGTLRNLRIMESGSFTSIGATATDPVVTLEVRGAGTANVFVEALDVYGGSNSDTSGSAIYLHASAQSMGAKLYGGRWSTSDRGARLVGVKSNGTEVTYVHVNGESSIVQLNAVDIQLTCGTGDIKWGKPLVALGGGSAATLGTIGGSGPVSLAQNTWLQALDSTGATIWLPVWK